LGAKEGGNVKRRNIRDPHEGGKGGRQEEDRGGEVQCRGVKGRKSVRQGRTIVKAEGEGIRALNIRFRFTDERGGGPKLCMKRRIR